MNEELYRGALLLILRYTIMLPEFLATAVFAKRECGTFCKRMADAASIRFHNKHNSPATIGGRSWLQGTTQSCKAHGFPTSRAVMPSPEAMDHHLAMLWDCFADASRQKQLLEPTEVVEVLGVEMPVNVSFVLEESCLWRMLCTQRDITDACLAVRRIHDELSKVNQLRDAIAGGHLGVAICVESERKYQGLVEAIRTKIGTDQAVGSLIKPRCLVAPTCDTLPEMAKALNRRRP